MNYIAPIRRPAALIAIAAALACSSSDPTTSPPPPPPPAPPGAPPVATVTVAPPTLNLVAGDTSRLTATMRDASNAILAGRAVAWSTSNAGFATVNTSGLVTAVAAGPATITATSETKTGTSAVTVAAAGSGAAVNECSTPQAGRIWCDDFEQNRLSSYFEYDNPGGNFTRTASVGRSSSFGMRGHWTVGASSAGDLHLAFGKTPQAYMAPVDAGTAIYKEIYWRMFVRLQPGWTGGGADKLSRAHIFASSTSFAQALAMHVWSGNGADVNYLTIDPASGTDATGNLVATVYNDPNFRWFGQVRGNVALYSSANAGNWYCVEAHVKLNDVGQSNGVFELWINGTLDAQRTGMNLVGNFSAYGINAIYFENFWNNGSPQAQDRFFDNLVVSTQRINC